MTEMFYLRTLRSAFGARDRIIENNSIPIMLPPDLGTWEEVVCNSLEVSVKGFAVFGDEIC